VDHCGGDGRAEDHMPQSEGDGVLETAVGQDVLIEQDDTHGYAHPNHHVEVRLGGLLPCRERGRHGGLGCFQTSLVRSGLFLQRSRAVHAVAMANRCWPGCIIWCLVLGLELRVRGSGVRVYGSRFWI